MQAPNRAAYARGTIYVGAGVAILGGFVLLIGPWWTVAGVVVGLIGVAVDAWRRPWWRLW